MSDLPPDAMETAWERSDSYEFQGRKLTWSRTHSVMAERIGLNLDHAIDAGKAKVTRGDAKGETTVLYDGLYEDIGVILFVASLDKDGLRAARRNPEAAKDAACEIFEDWGIPLKGPVFDEARNTAMAILSDVQESQTTTINPEDEPDADAEKKTV